MLSKRTINSDAIKTFFTTRIKRPRLIFVLEAPRDQYPGFEDYITIALLIKESSVDVDSKQLDKTICYFPIKTRHTDAVGLATAQITILLQSFALLKVVNLYLLIYYRVLE